MLVVPQLRCCDCTVPKSVNSRYGVTVEGTTHLESATIMKLRTERLHLRKYGETDISAMVALLGAPEVAATTLRIPHPYTEADARDYLNRQATNASSNWFGVFVMETGELCGGVGLSVEE